MKRLLNKSPPLGKHFFSFFLTPHFARPKPGATIPGDSRRMTILPRRSRVKDPAFFADGMRPRPASKGPAGARQNIFSLKHGFTLCGLSFRRKKQFSARSGPGGQSAARVQPFSTAERFKQKKRPQSALRTFPFLWCRRGDSNSHSLARTRP